MAIFVRKNILIINKTLFIHSCKETPPQNYHFNFGKKPAEGLILCIIPFIQISNFYNTVPGNICPEKILRKKTHEPVMSFY